VVEMTKREGKKNGRKTGGEAVFFFSFFTPNFLLFQTMKSILIYRGWKMDVSSLMVSNLSL